MKPSQGGFPGIQCIKVGIKTQENESTRDTNGENCMTRNYLSSHGTSLLPIPKLHSSIVQKNDICPFF